MEHLSTLQERYADQGLTVIGLTDEPLQTAVRFLCGRHGVDGPLQNERIRYALAADPDRSVHRDYFEAAGLLGIPATFVIGRTGIIEWIGNPAHVGPVLAAVFDGTYDRDVEAARIRREQEASRRLRELHGRIKAARASQDWPALLAALDELILARGEEGELSIPIRFVSQLSLAGDPEGAYEYGRRVMEQAWEENSWLLYQLAWAITGTMGSGTDHPYPVPPEHQDLDFAWKAAHRAAELEGFEDETTLSMLARVHALRGEYGRSVQFQEKALQAFEAMRPRIPEHQLPHYLEGRREMVEVLEGYRRLRDRRPMP